MIKYAVKYNKEKYSLKTVGLDIQTDTKLFKVSTDTECIEELIQFFRRKKMIPNHRLEKAFE